MVWDDFTSRLNCVACKLVTKSFLVFLDILNVLQAHYRR
uniref:Uncharacterized protein n=1 Tax=Anguilla anguilla TaxID=7936 RepID=A0A0E9T644_ANGAN